MPDAFGPVLAGVATVGAVGGFGYFIDGKLSDEFRDNVRDKLKRVSGADDTWPAWPTLFLTMFDRLFVPQQRRRPSFKRSAAASIIILVLILILWAVLLPQRLGSLVEETRGESLLDHALNLWGVLSLAVTINIFVDYCSLWESRLVIARMANGRGAANNVAYLLADFIATLAIFVIGFAIVFLFGDIVNILTNETADLSIFYFSFRVLYTIVRNGLLFSYGWVFIDPLVACFYTTLFTSVWVWIFMLGGVLWPLFSRLSNVLAVDKYPVGSVMAIGGVFLGLAVTAAGYVRMAITS